MATRSWQRRMRLRVGVARVGQSYRFLKWTFLVLALVFASVSAEAEGDRGPAAVDALRERILAHLAVKPGMTIAEIGIGGGWFVTRLATAVGPHGVVFGTDIAPEAIAAVARGIPDLPSTAGRIDLRLCRDGRDTALDDLPDNHLDIVLMVDSLCFDAKEPRARNVDYLRRFQRILRPGGRLVHHMDCHCPVSPEELTALFTEAGFSPGIESIDASAEQALIGAEGLCPSPEQRKRHALIAVFHKAVPDTGVGAGAHAN